MLTSKQHELLSYIVDRIASTGCSPTFDEMRIAMSLRSKSGVHRLVGGLEERGFISRRIQRARSIEVLRDIPNRNARFAALRTASPPVVATAAAPPPLPPARESTVVDFRSARRMTSIPLYGSIAAGVPFEAVGGHHEFVDVPEALIGASGEHYALRVVGESMTGDHIMDGDTAIVRRCEDPVESRILAVLVGGGEVALKRLRVNGATAYLESSNPAFATRAVPASSVRVQGCLVSIMRNC